MIVKYRIDRYTIGNHKLIERVEVEKETAEFVMLPAGRYKHGGTYRARRERKDGHYFDTFAEAKAEMLKREHLNLERLNNERSRVINKIQRISAELE